MNDLACPKKLIYNQQYEVGFFPAFYNYNLFIKFSSVAGGSFSKVFTALSNNKNANEGAMLDQNIDLESMGEAIRELVTSLYLNDRDGLMMLEIMAQTRRNGVAVNKDTFNQFYTGNMDEMMAALMFSVSSHFKQFFLGALSGFQQSQDQATAKITAS